MTAGRGVVPARDEHGQVDVLVAADARDGQQYLQHERPDLARCQVVTLSDAHAVHGLSVRDVHVTPLATADRRLHGVLRVVRVQQRRR